MSRKVAFRQCDVERAVKAVTKAVGKPYVSVHFPPEGGFSVLTADEPAQQPALTPLEAWRAKRGHSAA